MATGTGAMGQGCPLVHDVIDSDECASITRAPWGGGGYLLFLALALVTPGYITPSKLDPPCADTVRVVPVVWLQHLPQLLYAHDSMFTFAAYRASPAGDRVPTKPRTCRANLTPHVLGSLC